VISFFLNGGAATTYRHDLVDFNKTYLIDIIDLSNKSLTLQPTVIK
jgi:hypothetical protein